MAFFQNHCILEKLETRKMISKGHECGGLYHLDLDSKPVACSSFVFAFDQHYWLGHLSLQVLKLLVS